MQCIISRLSYSIVFICLLTLLNKVSSRPFGPQFGSQVNAPNQPEAVLISSEKRCGYNNEVISNAWYDQFIGFKKAKTCETCRDGKYYNKVDYPDPIPARFLSGNGEIQCAFCPEYTMSIGANIYKKAVLKCRLEAFRPP